MSNSVKNPPENSAGSVAAFPPSHLGELIIEIWSFGFERWIGTRAQLEAEGLIPTDLKWPVGFLDVGWRRGAFDFRLYRCKPDGAKGPRSLWKEVDYWAVNRYSVNRTSHLQDQVAMKAAELRALLWKQTPEGIQQTNRWARACSDEPFQNFMASALGRELHGGRGKFSFSALRSQEAGHD